MTILDTARTRLEPFKEKDEHELLSVFRDPGVRKYLLDDQLVDLDWVRLEIETSQQRFDESGAGLWAIRLIDQLQSPDQTQSTDRTQIVGFVGYREFFDPPQLQLIYGLLPAIWGQGLATEVSRECCHHGFKNLGFKSIRAAIDTPHEASRRVLESLGFVETSSDPSFELGTTFFELPQTDWDQQNQDR